MSPRARISAISARRSAAVMWSGWSEFIAINRVTGFVSDQSNEEFYLQIIPAEAIGGVR